MQEKEIINLIKECESGCKEVFDDLDNISQFNQEKVLLAFEKERVSLRHFSCSNGYGYDDISRDTLQKVFANIFGCESAIVSPLITCGSHAIAIALYGLLRPGDTFLSISGKPYDTLDEVIWGKNGIDNGSLKDLGINAEVVELKNGKLDEEQIIKSVLDIKPKVIFLQRSRGYEWRDALSIENIEKIIKIIRNNYTEGYIVVDNCYGEFVSTCEPTEVGADVCIGSLIKNIGGGIAPTGAYIVGTKEAIEKVSYRFTSPSLGLEVGSYEGSYRPFYQGLFMAPHIVNQATKGAALFSSVFRHLGYEVLPKKDGKINDIITSIILNDKQKLIDFCSAIQSVSPVDSYLSPEPWAMPGYTSQVIMAAGTFVMGASIELSCDSPVKPPYIVYLQGGLTIEHIKYAIKRCLTKF